MHAHNAINQEVHRDGLVVREGRSEGREGEEEACGTAWVCISKIEAKISNGTTQNENEQEQIDVAS